MFKMTEDIVKDLNKDCLTATGDMADKLVGNIEVQRSFTVAALNRHGSWFCDVANEYAQALEFIDLPQVEIGTAWYNRMLNPLESNPTHIHGASLMTSVGYLKLPRNFQEELRKPHKDGRGGGLRIYYGEYAPLSVSEITLVPEVGDYYVFPSVLRHAVAPLLETLKGERRSFSINFKSVA